MTLLTPPVVQENNLKNETAAGARTARPSKLRLAGQTLGYLALCLLALEGVFHLAQVGDSEYIKPDKGVGYKPMEGKTITQRREGFGHFTYNSFGMQNDEISLAKPPGMLRIAVLGDSYVESIQVDRRANYCSLLAADLSAKLQRPVQVLNFGVANYSIAQDYLRYQNLAGKFKPDLVILGFRVEEVAKLLPEPTKKLMSVRPVFFPAPDGRGPNGDGLVYDNTCVRDYYASQEGRRINSTYLLRRYSNIWGVVANMAQTLMAGGKSTENTKNPENSKPAVGEPSAPPTTAAKPPTAEELAIAQARGNYTKCYWNLMEAQLSALARACNANDSKLMIMRTPSGSTNEMETALLLQTADKLGLKVLEIDRRYRNTFTPAESAGHFLGHGHFTTTMHRWVADQMCDFLTRQQPKLLETSK